MRLPRILPGLTLVLSLSATTAAATPPVIKPPAMADDPSLRAAIVSARECFDSTWDVSRSLRLQTEKVVEGANAPLSRDRWIQARTIVADYLASRAAILRCATNLRERAVGHVTTDNDGLALQETITHITFNHDEQTAYEVRILRSLAQRAPAL